MLNKNDRVIIKATEETGTITNIFNVEGTTYYELEDRVKAYTCEELLQFQVAVEEQRQTFEDSTASIPVPLDINTPIIKADAIIPDDSFVDKMLGHRIAIEQEQGESSLTINTDPGDEVSTITIKQTEYDELTEDSDILKRVRNLINK
ncbi:hypothetical protein [Macrococcus capreoli]|uniref:hypothetical protein n=1 Tax=Macrococcus capreoli TaxID=2982690 RepID=UPI003EE6A19F